MKNTRKLLINLSATLLAVLAMRAANADITIGVSLPLTGPASGLGIPCKNGISLWPATLAGEKLNVIVLDDASDPTNGAKNARRFTTEDKVDLIVGSAATPVAIAMADIAAESQTMQFALSPAVLPEGKDAWTFRLPQSTNVMAMPIVEHWKKTGVKTFGFIGYADAYGESWLKDLTSLATAAGIKAVAVERFGRNDTSVTGQVLKITSANPDAVLVVASGSGAAMPHKALVERGYPKGKIYQTHSAATMDLMRVGGKDVEGAFVSSGPALVGSLLPDNNPSKAISLQYIEQYDKAFGKGTANQFGAHSYDAFLLLQKIVPEALKKAKPGTKEFRAALKDALETSGRVPVSQGVLAYTKTDLWGFTTDTGVLLTVKDGTWALAK
jgi:branched-chain amino acid transport system substrate-binding protein